FVIGPAGLWRVPGDVDVALAVCGHGAPAIESVGVSNYIPFGFESRARVVNPRVKERRFDGGRSHRSSLAQAIPHDMHAAILSNRELSAPNGADGRGGAWLSIHLDGFGEIILSRFTVHIENVARVRLAFEIDQVNCPFRVDDTLWLDAVVGCAHCRDGCRL